MAVPGGFAAIRDGHGLVSRFPSVHGEDLPAWVARLEWKPRRAQRGGMAICLNATRSSFEVPRV